MDSMALVLSVKFDPVAVVMVVVGVVVVVVAALRYALSLYPVFLQ